MQGKTLTGCFCSSHHPFFKTEASSVIYKESGQMHYSKDMFMSDVMGDTRTSLLSSITLSSQFDHKSARLWRLVHHKSF